MQSPLSLEKINLGVGEVHFFTCFSKDPSSSSSHPPPPPLLLPWKWVSPYHRRGEGLHWKTV
jgi:hypothetical protein